MAALCSSASRFQFGASAAVCFGAEPSLVISAVGDHTGQQGKSALGRGVMLIQAGIPLWNCNMRYSRCLTDRPNGYICRTAYCLARGSVLHVSTISNHRTGLTSVATQLRLLGIFTKLRKATISSVMSVRREQLSSCSTDLREEYVMWCVSRNRHVASTHRT